MRTPTDIMIELVVVWTLKATLAFASAAWTLLAVEGNWLAVAGALPGFALAAVSLRVHSRRLRGKRAEGST